MPQESADLSYFEEGVSPSVTAPVVTEAIVTFSTPFPTETPELRPTFSLPPDDKISNDNYSMIYDETVTYNYNVIPIDYILDYPPMIFEYSATVPTSTRTKGGSSQFGSKSDYTVSVEIPDPNANYKISVYDKETNELIDAHEIPIFSEKSVNGIFKIYEPGNYHIEITGNLATVNTIIKVNPENLENKKID